MMLLNRSGKALNHQCRFSRIQAEETSRKGRQGRKGEAEGWEFGILSRGTFQ
jgi:hypothetical protein